MTMDRKTRRRNRKILLRKVVIFVFAVFFIFSIAIFFYINSLSGAEKFSDRREPIDLIPGGFTSSLSLEVREEMEGIVNIVVFGLDKKEEEISRTDTIMIASIDRSNKKLKLISLMRDMYVDIPGKWRDRINAAYVYGGPLLGMDTINKNFDMDIKHYFTVDFKGIHKLISKLGGVDIDVKEGEIPYLNECLDEINNLDPENIEPAIILPGMQHLMGKQSLSYTRIRYFGNGDFERTERQRKVAVQLFEKVKGIGILKLPDLIASTLPYIETNMSITDIISLGACTLKFKNDTEQYRLPVDGTFYDEYIRGMAVLVPNIEDNTRMLHKFIYGNKNPVPATN